MIRTFAIAALLTFAAAPLAAAPVDDKQQEMLLGYARTLITQGKPQEAITRYLEPVIAAYEAAYPANGDQIYCARTSAETLLYMGMAASAMNKGNAKGRAIAIGPTFCDALFLKAFALVDLAQVKAAQPLFERLTALAPMNAQYWSELGNLHQQARDWPKALETFQQALGAADFSPPDDKLRDTTRALRGTGYALTEMGRFDESEAAYRKCLALDPGDRVAQAELRYIAGLRAKRSKPAPTI